MWHKSCFIHKATTLRFDAKRVQSPEQLAVNSAHAVGSTVATCLPTDKTQIAATVDLLLHKTQL